MVTLRKPAKEIVVYGYEKDQQSTVAYSNREDTMPALIARRSSQTSDALAENTAAVEPAKKGSEVQQTKRAGRPAGKTK